MGGRGTFVADRKHGAGRMEWADRASYEGQWVDGQPHGEGVLRERSGGVFEGDFVGGEARAGPGVGRQTYADGSWYEGPWRAGMRHGRGTYRRPAAAASRQNGANHDPGAPEAREACDTVEEEDGSLGRGGASAVSVVEDGPSSTAVAAGGVGGGEYAYVGEWERNVQSGVGRERAADGTDYQGEVRPWWWVLVGEECDLFRVEVGLDASTASLI